MPRWQNLKNPREEKFIRGYSVYPGGGCSEYPWYATPAEGFGSAYKRDAKRRYPTPVGFTIQAPSLRMDSNFVDIDPEAKDSYGIPKVRIHFQWDENVLKMWEHSKEVCAEIIRKAGGVYEGSANKPFIPGWSLHETGTCRMGNDPKTRRNQWLRADARRPEPLRVRRKCVSMAFTSRTCEHMIENFRRGDHQST